MNKLIAVLFVSIMLAACNQNRNKDSFLLSGKLSALANDTVLLLHQTDSGTVADTSIAKNDSFSFTGKCPEPRVYVLQWYMKNTRQGGVRKNDKEIFIENASITVSGKADGAEEKVIVSGSASQQKYDSFLAIVKPMDDGMDSIGKIAMTLDADKNKKELLALDTAYDMFDAQKKDKAAYFISQNINSPVSPFIALRNFGTESPEVGKLDTIFHSLDTVAQNAYYGKQLSSLIVSLKKLEPGMPAPDFTLNDSSGNPVSLNSYKGKVVMIDFWASWCGPCRKENPNVVKAYSKFHPEGFEILGVSLDQKRDKWIAAIAKDNLSWQHVSDLKGWSNSAAKLYAIRSIPNNYLIDKNGNIVAKSLYGDELTKKLEEVLR